jgi:predicted negative regulator of RcsB-dependent stress response
MASHKLTKQEMRQDEFRSVLAELYFGALGYISENWKGFAIGFAAVLLLLAGGFYLWQAHEAKLGEQSYLLAQVMDAYNAPVQAGAKPQGQQTIFSSDSQRDQEVTARLAKYSKDAGASSPLAVYYKALTQADAGQVAEAISTVTPVATNPKFAPIGLALRARLYETQSNWDKAEADWKTLTTTTTPTWTPADGWMALGQYYQRRDMKDKAIDAYQQVEKVAGSEAKDDPLARTAKSKIEELKGAA